MSYAGPEGWGKRSEGTTNHLVKAGAPWPVRLIERITAGTGVVALAEDLDLTNLRGAIQAWVNLYATS